MIVYFFVSLFVSCVWIRISVCIRTDYFDYLCANGGKIKLHSRPKTVTGPETDRRSATDLRSFRFAKINLLFNTVGSPALFYLGQCSHLMPGNDARVRYSLGANVNPPFFQVPTLKFGWWAPGPCVHTVFVSSWAVCHCFVLAAKLIFQSGVWHRPRAVSLFSWSIEQNTRDTQMTTRVTEGARQLARARARVHSPH